VNQARAEPSSAKQLLAFHIECGGEEVSSSKQV
jgi:hypothetical protein